MLKFKNFFPIILSLMIFFQVNTAQAQATSMSSMDPKTKAFLVIASYGTVGGALLGLASMAFGQNSRAIAKGASLGLYAGILFGAYVILTQGSNSYSPAEPSQEASPYEDPYVPYNGDGTTYLNWHNSSYAKLQEKEIKTAPQLAWTWNF